MFKEKDLEFLCESLDVNIDLVNKKRMVTLIATPILSVLMFLYSHNWAYPLLIIILGIFIFKLDYWDLKNRFKQKASIAQLSFNSFFGYILVFLENNFNLYQSIKTTIEYVDESIKPLVEQLLLEIDEDKTVTPYVNFSNNFSSQIVGQICLLLYQLENSGYDSSLLDKFNPLLEKLRQQTIDEYINHQSSKLDFFGIFPLVATIVITFSLILGILQSLVVLING